MDSVVNGDMEEVVPLNGRFFKKLFQTGLGQSVPDPIIDMKARKTSRDALAIILSNPKKLMEVRFEQLELDGRPFWVFPYPTVEEVFEIEDSLGAFDSRYDPNEITKSQLQKMPSISNCISSFDHFRITKYTLEYCLCANQGCIVCAEIEHGVITPNISIKGNNVRGEIMRWMYLPIIDHLDKGSFHIYIQDTGLY